MKAYWIQVATWTYEHPAEYEVVCEDCLAKHPDAENVTTEDTADHVVECDLCGEICNSEEDEDQ